LLSLDMPVSRGRSDLSDCPQNYAERFGSQNDRPSGVTTGNSYRLHWSEVERSLNYDVPSCGFFLTTWRKVAYLLLLISGA
jgi:hypothetical protein